MKNGQKTGFPIEFLGFDATNRKLSMRSRTWNKSEGPDPSKTGFYKDLNPNFENFRFLVLLSPSLVTLVTLVTLRSAAWGRRPL